MRFERTIAIVGSILLLAGCSGSTTKDVKTVSWYKSHLDEAQAMAKKCADNPGELAKDPNCVNANEALFTTTSGPSALKIQ